MPENPLEFALYFVSGFGYLIGLFSMRYGFKTKSKPAKYFAFITWGISSIIVIATLLTYR